MQDLAKHHISISKGKKKSPGKQFKTERQEPGPANTTLMASIQPHNSESRDRKPNHSSSCIEHDVRPRSGSKSKPKRKLPVEKLAGRLKSLEEQRQGVDQYLSSLKGELLLFFQQSAGQGCKLHEWFSKCLATVYNGFVREFTASARVDHQSLELALQKEKLTKEIEVYIHWNENLLNQIEKAKKGRIADCSEEETAKNRLLLEEQQKVLAGAAERERQIVEAMRVLEERGVDVRKMLERKRKKPEAPPSSGKANLRLNLEGLKRQDFNQQFYSELQKFSHSWREQALKERRY